MLKKLNFMESFLNDLNRVMSDITRILKQYGIKFIFIGGAARNQYNYYSTTEDIDILVDSSDRNKFKNIPIGFIREISSGRNKVFMWSDPQTRLEVIYSGEISGDGINGLRFPDPSNIEYDKNGIPVISLYALIEFKISSGIYGKRIKDFADVEALILRNNLDINYGNSFRKDLKEKYIELWNSAHNIKII